jgi:polar amino acid transport system substrate-binding protein
MIRSKGAIGIALLLCPAFWFAAPEARAQGKLDQARLAGELRWGGDVQGGDPYVFEDPSRPGKLAGFEVDLADAIGRVLGVRARFVQSDWSTLVPALERGTFDIAMNGIEITQARSGRVRFTRPYYRFAERIVARTGDTRFSDLASLAGHRVGTLASSLGWDLLGQAGADRVPYEGVEEPFLDLQHGRIEAVLMDDIICNRYGARPGLAPVGDVAEGEYAIAVRREDQDLWRAVDGALGQIARAGELDAILGRWGIGGPRQVSLVGKIAQKPARDFAVPTTPAPTLTRQLNAHQIALFFRGAGITLLISVASMAIAMALGMALAVGRLPSDRSWRRLPRWLATAYVEIFRGTPVLLQLYVIYFALADVLRLDAFTAAVLGLGFNYAAYEAEIYRAGIQAVPAGQVEAGLALGMSGPRTFRRVVLPQAFRVSLPGVANDFIALLKDSSMVSVITVVELTKRMTIVAVDAGDWLLPGLLCAGLYFTMSYPLSRLALRIERSLGKGGHA